MIRQLVIDRSNYDIVAQFRTAALMGNAQSTMSCSGEYVVSEETVPIGYHLPLPVMREFSEPVKYAVKCNFCNHEHKHAHTKLNGLT